MSTIDKQYPIGRYTPLDTIHPEDLARWIRIIEDFPNQLEALVITLTEDELNSPYREGGWTGRQVIHHLMDSHLHCYIRFKAALTEGINPTVKDYDENGYAQLEDGKNGTIQWSILGIKAIHGRWVELMRSFSEEDWKKSYYHPTRKRDYVLDQTLGIYAHHCNHHLAHLKLITGELG